jgi:hypothetical protein
MFAASRSIHKGLKTLHFFNIFISDHTHTHTYPYTRTHRHMHTYIPIRTPTHTHTSSSIEHYYFITTHSSGTHGNGAWDGEQEEGGLLRNGDEQPHG